MYKYENLKPQIFTEEGQEMFLKTYEGVKDLISKSGSITMGKAMNFSGAGDSWMQMACVDRMVEMGALREIQQTQEPAGQNRIFIWNRF